MQRAQVGAARNGEVSDDVVHKHAVLQRAVEERESHERYEPTPYLFSETGELEFVKERQSVTECPRMLDYLFRVVEEL